MDGWEFTSQYAFEFYFQCHDQTNSTAHLASFPVKYEI